MALDPRVVLLIGAETAILDESSYARTLTAVGGAARTTAQFKYGSAAITFDGSGDYVQAADSADWNFGAGDFTVEGWFRLTNKANSQALIGQWDPVLQSDCGWFFYIVSGQLTFRGVTGSTLRDVAAAWTPTLGQWYHLAADRSGSTLRVYINGVVVASDAAYSITLNNSPDALTLGAITTGGTFPAFDFDGQMDEIRITKGLAQYAGAFTPPTGPFPRAFTLVASTTATPGTNGGTTAAINTTGATLLVLGVSWYTANTGAPAISDNKGNTWTPLTGRAAGIVEQQFFVVSSAPNVGTGHTFTVAGFNFFPAIIVYAFSGPALVLSGQNGTAATSSAGPLSTGSLTPSASPALILSGFGATAASPTAVTGGLASTLIPFSSGAVVGGGAAWVEQATAAAINPQWSWSASSDVGLSVVAFVPLTAAASARVTQLAAETVSLPTPAARVTQVVAETISLPTPAARVTQVVAEVIGGTGVASAASSRVTQVVAETVSLPTPPARVTQLVAELLGASAPPPAIGRVTQVVVETLTKTPPIPGYLTQTLVELLTTKVAAVDQTQTLVELLTTLIAQVRLTQQVLEWRTGGSGRVYQSQQLVEVFLVYVPHLELCTPSLPVDPAAAADDCVPDFPIDPALGGH